MLSRFVRYYCPINSADWKQVHTLMRNEKAPTSDRTVISLQQKFNQLKKRRSECDNRGYDVINFPEELPNIPEVIARIIQKRAQAIVEKQDLLNPEQTY